MIPKSLQAVLWSVDTKSLDKTKNATYIINQILAYGTWEQIKWLFKEYGLDKIRQIFTSYPEKDYIQASFNFVKNHLLKIKDILDETKYVKSYPRYIG